MYSYILLQVDFNTETADIYCMQDAVLLFSSRTCAVWFMEHCAKSCFCVFCGNSGGIPSHYWGGRWQHFCSTSNYGSDFFYFPSLITLESSVSSPPISSHHCFLNYFLALRNWQQWYIVNRSWFVTILKLHNIKSFTIMI